jgi:hypothetical protein
MPGPVGGASPAVGTNADPAGMRRRWARPERWRWVVAALLLVALAIGLVPSALANPGSIGAAAGFEDDDGNLAPDQPPINFDWNSFSPASWTGNAPYRTATKAANGWEFTGITDAFNVGNDTRIQMGPSTQDTDCPPVSMGNVNPNVDLKRIYIAYKTVNGHLYLMLAWVRLQPGGQPASDVAFEFN